MSEPVVSIIMPAFNVQDYIESSVLSVLSQSFISWELIIVDDCSTDATSEIVSRFSNDERIIFIKNVRNLGGAGSRNVAIEKARGRYIAFLDSDDLWAENKLENQIQFMQKNDFGFSFTGYTTICDNGSLLDRLLVPKKVNFNSLLKHNYIGCLTAIYDTKPFGKIYMPLVRKRQDFALWLELLKRFDYAYGLNENLGFYRIRADSLSRSKSDAFKYYWRVLREVGGCSVFSSAYNIMCYIFIVSLKKNFSFLYNRFFIS
jgi:glycosyltransferase involved in cell wall biosynthesis